MCSIGEDDFGDEGGLHTMQKDTIPTEETNVTSDICKKCNTSPIAVKLKFREAECKECFLAYARHKFRAALGSSKIVPKGATVLLVFDGSPESVVLLDMLNFAQTQNTFKRLHCSAKILFIDESVLNETSEDASLQQVQSFLLKYNFNSYIASIASTEFENITEYKPSGNLEFLKKFRKIKTLTSKQDFLQRLRNKLIGSVAVQLECNFVFLSDISTNLAATLLTNISLGRGGSTALDVSLVDTRIEGVTILRPLKDLNALEIESYLRVTEIKPLNLNIFGETNGIHASIQNLTKSFVSNLQKDYQSTVSTVFRTGDKIAPKSIEEKLENVHLNSRVCAFCKSNLDYFESNTLLAIEFSRLVSENAANSLGNIDNLEETARRNLYALNDGDQIKQLCHGCRNIYSDCLDVNLFC